MTKEELLTKLALLEKEVEQVKRDIEAIETDINNHIYESIEQAEDYIREFLYDRAYEDCQGAYNRGAEEYFQDFIVDGKKYRGCCEFEYNCHDKTYYYIDGRPYWSYEELEEEKETIYSISTKIPSTYDAEGYQVLDFKPV